MITCTRSAVAFIVVANSSSVSIPSTEMDSSELEGDELEEPEELEDDDEDDEDDEECSEGSDDNDSESSTSSNSLLRPAVEKSSLAAYRTSRMNN